MSDTVVTCNPWPTVIRIAITAIIAKGVVMAVIIKSTIALVAAGTVSILVGSIIVAAVSATITGAFSVLTAYLVLRLQRPRDVAIHEIKEAVTDKGSDGLH